MISPADSQGTLVSMGHSGRRGFSLPELLAVTAIVALLLTAMVPMVGRMGNSSGPGGAAAVVSQAASEARTNSVAKRTYTYLALGAPVNGASDELAVGIFATDDGMPLGSSGVDPARARFIAPIRSIPRAAIASVGSDQGGLEKRERLGVLAFPITNGGIPVVSFPIGGNARYVFNDGLIEFAPDGTARAVGTQGVPRILEIGFVPLRGDTRIEQSNEVSVIQISGITGLTKIFRP